MNITNTNTLFIPAYVPLTLEVWYCSEKKVWGKHENDAKIATLLIFKLARDIFKKINVNCELLSG